MLTAGYTRRAVFEVALGTALKVLSNYTNHIALTPVTELVHAMEAVIATGRGPARQDHSIGCSIKWR